MSGVYNAIPPATYKCTDVLTEPYLIVVIDTAAGTCRLPTSAGDRDKTLGIAQSTTKQANQAVAVQAGMTSSYLVADEAILRGARVQAQVTGNKGRAINLAAPTAPAGATTPTAGEVDAARDYATAVLNYLVRAPIVADEAAAAQGNLFTARIGALG